MKEKKYALYISPDADVVYQDSMGTCASCEYDEISREYLSIGPPFKAVLPGLRRGTSAMRRVASDPRQPIGPLTGDNGTLRVSALRESLGNSCRHAIP